MKSNKSKIKINKLQDNLKKKWDYCSRLSTWIIEKSILSKNYSEEYKDFLQTSFLVQRKYVTTHLCSSVLVFSMRV